MLACARAPNCSPAARPPHLCCAGACARRSVEARAVLPTAKELSKLSCPSCHSCGNFECAAASAQKRLTVWTRDGAFTCTMITVSCKACPSRAEAFSSAHARILLDAEATSPLLANSVVSHSAIDDMCVPRASSRCFAASRQSLPPQMASQIPHTHFDSSRMLRRLYTDEDLNRSAQAYGRLLEHKTSRRIPGLTIDDEVLRRLLHEKKRQREMLRAFEILPGTLLQCPVRVLRMQVCVLDGNFMWYHFDYASAYRAYIKSVVGTVGCEGALGGICEGALAGRAAVERVAECLNTMLGRANTVPKSCGPAEVDAMRGKCHGPQVPLDCDGLYAGCCGHGVVFGAHDFKGGEKAIFPLQLYLLGGKPADILCGDSVCRLHGLFEQAMKISDTDGQCEALANLGIKWLEVPARLAVNAMHVQGVGTERSRSRLRWLHCVLPQRTCRAHQINSPRPRG